MEKKLFHYASGKGFTLIEMLVVICIIGILSSIILFSVTQYIGRGKDASVQGNLAVLITAGEVYYDINTTNPNSYNGFCSSDKVKNIFSQLSVPSSPPCPSAGNPAGVCCKVSTDGNRWSACAQLFSNPSKAYCIDSTGTRKEILYSSCVITNISCP